ncbi:dipeptide epimerase [Peteryoungia desertarenae]|uniref:Dipeptide epimerase n=1 Tax=Peteryoungia desertarenae TaxID=1813451 RepID=A0ABX6QSA5_9HYPH|nr:N-acetyl-D-Glu racemase DgcA [Peteryoungia desertarenae]QLF71152.1 dipeptide epimerase [Peteryoungia desertarenae]
MTRRLQVAAEIFPVDGAFTISRGSRTEIRVVTVTLTEDGYQGQGECVPYARYGETVEGVMAEIEALAPEIAAGLNRQGLQLRLPPGAARNALDCAFWDLEAKRLGRPVWQLAGLAEPKPLQTAFTLSLASPESMQAVAADNAHRPLLKVKLGGEGDLARIEAVRRGAPKASIIVDANEGWTVEAYRRLAPDLLRLGVVLVEQPLPAGDDDALLTLDRILPVCADESCHTASTLETLKGKYDALNIKLDKTGGLTEALALRDAARSAGFGVMVGCMLGTSLAMAPAFLVAQGADYVDLDGPLLLGQDRVSPIAYEGSLMQIPPAALWG